MRALQSWWRFWYLLKDKMLVNRNFCGIIRNSNPGFLRLPLVLLPFPQVESSELFRPRWLWGRRGDGLPDWFLLLVQLSAPPKDGPYLGVTPFLDEIQATGLELPRPTDEGAFCTAGTAMDPVHTEHQVIRP